MGNANKKTNVERLETGGVLNPATLSEEQKKKIELLSDDEVKRMISARGKVGDYSEKSHPVGRPWIL